MEGIQVSVHNTGRDNQISIIKVGGYIDTTTSSEVERALNSLLKQNRYQIIIDLGNVDYISSAGWGIFISEIKAIRENNGDLKLVQMIPDVYEIFELLEFHHILDVYDSIPAAVGKFEESQYVEMVSDAPGAAQKTPPFSMEATVSPTTSRPVETPHEHQQQDRMFNQSAEESQNNENAAISVDLINMPLDEKIKYLVANNPDLGAYKINKRLNSAEFGFTKVGWFGIRSWLNRLGLDSRQNRRRYAESTRNM